MYIIKSFVASHLLSIVSYIFARVKQGSMSATYRRKVLEMHLLNDDISSYFDPR